MSGSRAGRRAAGGAALGVFLVVLLSACAAIPTSGPVLTGRAVDPHEGLFQFNPPGPRSGESARAVVAGFLNAAAGFGNDHEVARDFLTAQRAQTWKPDVSVTIYHDETSLVLKDVAGKDVKAEPTPTPSAAPGSPAGPLLEGPRTAQVTVRTAVEASVDEDGRYTLAASGKTVTRTFTLVRNAGEWRIDQLDDGIMLAANDFTVTFQSFPVYFVDPTGRYLVPDLHWFAGTRDSPGSPELPTALARVLLKGPPPWLAGAVRTGAPTGTALAVAAVVVSDKNVATVDLNGAVIGASTRDRQLLLSQLNTTLEQLSPIESVAITVKGVALDIPPAGSGSGDQSSVPAAPGPNPLVAGGPVLIDSKGRLAQLEGSTTVPVKDVSGLSVPGANRPAVSGDRTAYAVLNAQRSKLLLELPGTKVPVTLVKSAGLSAPSFDPQNYVWTAAAVNNGSVFAAGADADSGTGPVKVKAPWLKKDEVVAMRISRDGTRAVIAVRYRGLAHLFLSGVVRDADGSPVSLTDPVALVPDLQSVSDVAWVDENKVVVLGRRAILRTAAALPWVVQIGGGIDQGTAVPGAVSITAGNGDQSVMVGTGKGVLQRSGALWDKVSTGTWPAFPG